MRTFKELSRGIPLRQAPLTLIVTTPHPAQRDVQRALQHLADASPGNHAVLTARHVGQIDLEHLRHLASHRRRQRVIIWAGLRKAFTPRSFGADDAARIRSVIEHCGGQRVQVVLLLSSQDRLIEMGYVKSTEAGASRDFGQYLRRARAVDLSYTSFIHSVRAIPRTQVRVLPWNLGEERISRLLEPLCRLAGIKTGGELRQFDRPPKVRATASRRGVRVAKDMHRVADTEHEHHLVRDFVRKEFRGKRLRDTEHLNAQQRQRLIERYASQDQTGVLGIARRARRWAARR